tara:strand:+ start:1387 stop:1668 length:282 start_codon:yes stop_codon:yes gene_type:complete
MKKLNLRQESSTALTKTEMRELIEVEKKKFLENGGVIEVQNEQIGPETPSCFTDEWEQPGILGIPSEIDSIYKPVLKDEFNFLREQYARRMED